MALVQVKPDAPANISNVPNIINEPASSNFSTLVPQTNIKTLLQYTEGYPWTTNYYGQIVNVSNTLDTFDPTTINLLAPYYAINNLVLQVSGPLNSSYDGATGITSVDGTAIAPYGVTPNVGDIFVANVDTGEDAIFVINSVLRKTYRKDTLYEVNYHMLGYLSTNMDMYNTLLTRVQDEYYYSKENALLNRNALITLDVKQAKDMLNIFLEVSKDYYFQSFMIKGLGGMFVPHENNKLYDPIFINFLLRTITIDYRCNTLSLFNYSNNKIMDQPSILSMLMNRNKSMVNVINKKYTFIPSANISNNARLGTLLSVGVEYVVYPMYVTDKYLVRGALPASTPSGYMSPVTANNSPGYNRTINTVTGLINLLPSMFANDSYIVSDNFYNYMSLQDTVNSSSLSFIELLIYKFINGIAIPNKDLVIAIEGYEDWDSLQQFYLIPVMWQIIRNNI